MRFEGMPLKVMKYGQLEVSVWPSTGDLGAAAARDFGEIVSAEIARRGEVSVILATGNSQLSFVSALRDLNGVDWSRVRVLHMDEYLGMSDEHPASFRRWMREKVVSWAKPQAFYGIRGDHASVAEEIARYGGLVKELDPVLCVMGIGENGHLAFNDPPADFDTDDLVKVVELDQACRMQQVGEGHFATLEEVPTHAITLTVRALLRPANVMVLTPEARKARAVKDALEGPVAPSCPASILQTTRNARLYLDRESSSMLDEMT